MKESNISIIQQIIPKYRINFFKELSQKLDYELYASNKGLEKSIKTIYDKTNHKINLVKNVTFFNKVNFQFLPFIKLFSKDIIVFEFNIRIVSNIFLLLIRIIAKKKNILWTHGITDKMSSFSKIIRLFFIKRANAIIVYEALGKKNLIKLGIKEDKIFFVKNSIDVNEVIKFLDLSANKFRITFIGRVIKDKNVALLCNAFMNILNEIEPSIILTIIGGGEDLYNLKKKFKDSNRIQFIGELYDENDIAYYLNQTLFTVSPDYLGLAIIHSYCYSAPILVNRYPKVQHSPEIEIFQEFRNGWYFEGTQSSLENKLTECLNNKSIIKEFGHNGLNKIKSDYNIETMVSFFYKAVESCFKPGN